MYIFAYIFAYSAFLYFAYSAYILHIFCIYMSVPANPSAYADGLRGSVYNDARGRPWIDME